MISILVVVQLVTALLGLLFGTGILMLVTKTLKVKGDFKTALIVNAVSSALSFVLGLFLPWALVATIISLGVVIFLVKRMYNLEWEKAVVVWLLWLVGSLIAGFLIGIVVAVFFVGSLFV